RGQPERGERRRVQRHLDRERHQQCGGKGHATTVAARFTGGLLLAAAAALALALRAPLPTTVLGLVAFGVLHNALDLLYVAGRLPGVRAGRFLALLVALVSGIVLCRVAGLVVGSPARYAEIVIGYAVLA